MISSRLYQTVYLDLGPVIPEKNACAFIMDLIIFPIGKPSTHIPDEQTI